MEHSRLSDFVKKVSSRGRITFGDIKRLQRDLLPNGAMMPDEVEALITMDGAVRRADPAWATYLTSTVVDFVVWGSRPTGYVDPNAAQWLEALLCSNPSKAARQILREVLREAQAVDPVLRDAMLASSFAPIGDRLTA
jgi:hypothetical protein